MTTQTIAQKDEILTIQLKALNRFLDMVESRDTNPHNQEIDSAIVRSAYFDIVNELRREAGKDEIKKYSKEEREQIMKEALK